MMTEQVSEGIQTNHSRNWGWFLFLKISASLHLQNMQTGCAFFGMLAYVGWEWVENIMGSFYSGPSSVSLLVHLVTRDASAWMTSLNSTRKPHQPSNHLISLGAMLSNVLPARSHACDGAGAQCM